MSVKIEGLTIAQLYEAYQISANIVAKYGDAYLPIFKRLHDEVQKLEQDNEIKTLALKISSAKFKCDSSE